MQFEYGAIAWERPRRAIDASECRHVLATAGKDVIRLAWSSLVPNENDYIHREKLATWLCEFFNMKHNQGNGNECIDILLRMGLLKKSGKDVCPAFDR